jgi:hypothetical protein
MRPLVVVAIAVAALVVAYVIQRRRVVNAPTQARWQVPAQLDRDDFAFPERAWLVAVFSSATCDTCGRVVASAGVLDSAHVAVDVVDYAARAELHRKYHIEAVPIVTISDASGVVRASHVGPMTATDLWAMVAEARVPGSTPRNDAQGCARPDSVDR